MINDLIGSALIDDLIYCDQWSDPLYSALIDDLICSNQWSDLLCSDQLFDLLWSMFWSALINDQWSDLLYSDRWFDLLWSMIWSTLFDQWSDLICFDPWFDLLLSMIRSTLLCSNPIRSDLICVAPICFAICSTLIREKAKGERSLLSARICSDLLQSGNVPTGKVFASALIWSDLICFDQGKAQREGLLLWSDLIKNRNARKASDRLTLLSWRPLLTSWTLLLSYRGRTDSSEPETLPGWFHTYWALKGNIWTEGKALHSSPISPMIPKGHDASLPALGPLSNQFKGGTIL
jgi:hypothetical protein